MYNTEPRSISETFKTIVNISTIKEINDEQIEEFGGQGKGFHNENLAQSIIAGVDQEVFGHKLNPTLEDKIAHVVIGFNKGTHS